MGVAVRPRVRFWIGMLIAVLILDHFWFLMVAGELLMQLPQLYLELFKRLALYFILGVAFQVAAPAVIVLPENVF